MFLFSGFIDGLASVLSFGWAKSDFYPIASPAKSLQRDWMRVGKDLNIALSKYQADRKNDKA